jgi:hypothetical protein
MVPSGSIRRRHVLEIRFWMLSVLFMSVLSNKKSHVVIIFSLLIAIKAAGLFTYGPIFAPDTLDFSRFADIILRSNEWLFYEDLVDGMQPPTSFRSIGYPMVLALMKSIGGANWPWFIIIFQLSLSLLASVFVFSLATHMSGNHGLGLMAALCHGVGQTIVLDQTIFSNSLNANLLLIMGSHVGVSILTRRRPSIFEVGLLGLMVLFAFLIREAGMYLQVLYWPLIFYWGLASTGGKFRSTLMVVVFAAPTLLCMEGYKSWNESRTGERYITTVAQTAMFFPGLELIGKGIPVFSNDAFLDDVGPLGEWPATSRGESVGRIRAHLKKEHGFNNLDVARFAMASYFTNWRVYPFGMTMISLSHLKFKQFFYAFRPMETAIQLRYWATWEWPWPRWGALWETIIEDDSRRMELLSLMVVGGLSRLISGIIAMAFFIGTPVVIIREVREKRWNILAYDLILTLMFLYWLLYFGYTFIYALVSLEMRYLMPVGPLAMVIGLTIIASYGQAFLQTWMTKRVVKDVSG